MNTDTALNHFRRMETRLRDILNASEGSRTHDEILQRVAEEIYNDPAFNRCPAWIRERLRTIFSERVHSWYMHSLVWVFPTENGWKFWGELSEAEKAPFCGDSRKTGSHVWLTERMRQWKDGKQTVDYTISGKAFN